MNTEKYKYNIQTEMKRIFECDPETGEIFLFVPKK